MNKIYKSFNSKKEILFAVVFLALIILLFRGFGAENNSPDSGADSGSKSEIYTVRGNSMYPLFKDGDTVTLLEGYYNSHSVERGDIVFDKYSPDRDPIMKTVKGIEGDTLALRQVVNKGVKANLWKIVINGKAIANSSGEEYEIPLSGYKMLSLYINDYRGVLPKGTVLLMGEQSGGSFDATQIGLTAVSDLMGKVITPPAK